MTEKGETLITRKTISEQAFDHIIDEIKSGNLKPGEQLADERSMAEELGISRVPLREAIKSLTQIGILQTKHGGGTFVNTNTSDVMTNAMNLYVAMEENLLLEFAEVRRVMEREAARLAAMNATQVEVEQMKKLCQERDRITSKDWDKEQLQLKLYELDQEIHMAIAEATHNSVFCNFLDSIRNAMRLQQEEASHQPDMLEKANDAHRKVIEAIAKGDAVAAAKAMEEHIEDVEIAIVNQKG